MEFEPKLRTGYLFAFDFDGTIADTFKPSPKGIDVVEAYRIAVNSVFGPPGEILWKNIGGLQNRSPSEFSQALLSQLGNTKEFRIKEIRDMIVQEKLGVLLSEIGPEWPLACKGFDNFWRTLRELRSAGIPISTAVLSNGHQEFIQKTFEQWGLVEPDFIVTVDDVAHRKYPKELERRTKPGLLQLAILHKDWLKSLGSSSSSLVEDARDARNFMIYFGDDPARDGGMANRANIPFCHFTSDRPLDDTISLVSFDNWDGITEFTKGNKEKFRSGNKIMDIFSKYEK